MHFEGADVVWAVIGCGNECYEEDAVWGGGKVEWRTWDGSETGYLFEGTESASIDPWVEHKVVRVLGGRVENDGHTLVFIPGG